MKQHLLVLIFLLLIFVPNIYGQDSIRKAPRIALVLSGGGAKGMAHIGVLKVLEKYNIPIDYITGTSMGAIIGGLYAIGYSADDLEKLTKSIDWNELFSGSINRIDVSIEEKNESDKYLLQFPFQNGKFILPKGLISGQKLEKLLSRVTWSVHGQEDFSKFPIPFACVATDIETGAAYVMNKGFLPDALRASMSIPSVFSPIEINGHLLVDGGLVRNLPASDAKNMGADIIIAVNVGSTLYKKEELTSMLAIMDQAASFRNALLLEDEKKLCDIIISPDISGYSAASFDATDSLIIRGEEAAIAMKEQFAELSEKLKKYNRVTEKKVKAVALHSIFINEVRIEGLEKVSEKLVRSRLNIENNTWIDLKNIEKAVDRVFGSQFFEKVNYKIIQQNDKSILIIRVYEQAFSFIKVGANYNNYFNASLLLNGTFRNILGEGSKLVISGKLGYAPEAVIDYSVFTRFKPNIGFRAIMSYYSIDEKLFFPDDSINLTMKHQSFSGKLAAVSALSNSVYLAAGLAYNDEFFNILELENNQYNIHSNFIRLFGEIYIDNYDRTNFPNKGIDVNLKADYLLFPISENDYDNNYWKFYFHMKRYIPISEKLNFNYSFNGSLVLSENVFIGDYYRLGGEIGFMSYSLPLSGFRFMEFTALNILSGRLAFRYELFKNKYIIVNTDAAFKSDQINQLVFAKELLFGAAVGVGSNTIIGPLEFKISKNNLNNRWEFWLQLGYKF